MPELPQPQDDGLYIPEVGEWSSDKHYYLMRYMDAFTTSMRDKWHGLHYIDLFAGTGIERLRESKALEWGSPMLAAQTRFPFTRLHLCEKNRIRFKALTARIDRAKAGTQLLQGEGRRGSALKIKVSGWEFRGHLGANRCHPCPGRRKRDILNSRLLVPGRGFHCGSRIGLAALRSQ
jgi:hypothetical protein